ncbi:HTH domain-containing protein [Marinifilum sp. N1E240]|uniref:HTH domain-containing protein n=1 Tax=Marinifilum sp. N1E240 TaxID=2608082 RepID=UPI00128C7C48|nr:HTH domain-containing protein [Marinifilum sp. N1E240]MPQ48222.1 HTH domain-containing protein [Marinifilum sp. N1E240]
MTHLELIEKTSYLKELIKKGKTGTPKELSRRLNISERSLSRLIKTLKDTKHPIIYSRVKQSYITE